MRIEYKILWVEDDKSWYKTTLELFKTTVEELGFILVSKKCENIEEVKEAYALNKLKEYDMLLVDYTLKNSDSGDKIIEFIRGIKEEPILTDVLFYSSAVENVRDSMHQLGLEGVYIADRKEIENKFELVFNTTIKKVQDLNNIRGLLMAETSDMDEHMRLILLKFFSSNTSFDGKEKLQEAICKKIKESLNSKVKKIEKICNEGNVEKLIKHPSFDASKMARTINELINEMLKKEELSDLNSFYEDYNLEIIIKRNIFGHVTESIKDGAIILMSHHEGKDPIEFTEEVCKEIRLNIKKHKARLVRIHDSF